MREAEIERVYRERGGRMWQSVLAFTGDPEIASDSVAEAFALALRKKEGIREIEPWIWRVLFRVAGRALSERRRTDWPVPEAPYEMGEPARELIAALRELSDKQRRAVVLHHGAGYPVEEVARMIGSTSAAVRVHLLRGRRRLRELLGDADV